MIKKPLQVKLDFFSSNKDFCFDRNAVQCVYKITVILFRETVMPWQVM